MSVVFAIPSKRKPDECQHLIDQWAERGYLVVLRRLVSDAPHPKNCAVLLRTAYHGWAASVNELCSFALADAEVQWIVTGGDDYAPDQNKTADEIAGECEAYFLGKFHHVSPRPLFEDEIKTFGVMQPTGDRWGADEDWAKQHYPDAPAFIDRICGSPWMGRAFCQRAYGGNGPLHPGYKHMFADEELQNVAKSMGILWQRPDLTQMHHHWGRKEGGNLHTGAGCPDWLKWANTKDHWDSSRALFQNRKATGFPGSAAI